MSEPFAGADDPGGEVAPAGVWRWQDPVVAAVRHFRPAGSPPGWDRIAPEVRRIVLEAGPRDPAHARMLMRMVGLLALFAEDQGYRPAKAPAFLAAEVIDRFARKNLWHLSEATRRRYTSTLSQVALVVLGNAGKVKQPKLSSADDHRPYTLSEMAALWSWAGGQPTERLRRGCRVLLALGRGCGVGPREIVQARAHDVRRADDREGPVYLTVRGPGAREVVCRRRWEDHLYAEARVFDGQSRYLFQPGCHNRGAGVLSAFIAQTSPAPATPVLRPSRLRATWLVDLLEAGLPLSVVVPTAGPDAIRAIQRVLPYLAAAEAADAARRLRGQAQ